MVCITPPLSFGEVLNHSYKKDFSLDSSFRSIHSTLWRVNRIIADMGNYRGKGSLKARPPAVKEITRSLKSW
jgi:hypothetical protein